MNSHHDTILDVFGMSCPSCVRHISAALHEVDGVREVEVRVTDGKVRVRHEPHAALADMLAALREAGYESSPAQAA